MSSTRGGVGRTVFHVFLEARSAGRRGLVPRPGLLFVGRAGRDELLDIGVPLHLPQVRQAPRHSPNLEQLR
jgi:hypothetical protein